MLDELRETYAERNAAQFVVLDVPPVPPNSACGNAMAIARVAAGAERWKQAVDRLQALLHIAAEED